MLSVAVILGTRPEAIKLFPVIEALKRDRKSYRVTTIATGQHRAAFADTARALGLVPDISLNVQHADQSLNQLSAALLADLDVTLARIAPSLVLVQGDTQTAVMGAIAARLRRIPVGHVEAGLRSGNAERPFPEEMNRQMIARTAHIHFAPSDAARQNLLREGIGGDSIAVTGNTAIDSLSRFAALNRWTRRLSNMPLILATCHRRESWDNGVDAVCDALIEVAVHRRAAQVVFVLPVAPQLRCAITARLVNMNGISLCNPLPYDAFLKQLTAADLVVSDSGGLQEETSALGIPIVVLRAETDRPEALGSRTVRLAGTATADIVDGILGLLDQPRRLSRDLQPNPFGDGCAAARILLALKRWQQGHRPLLAAQEQFCGPAC